MPRMRRVSVGKAARSLPLVLALLLLFPASSALGTKYAGEFLRIGVGARAIGMGGAFTAVSDDASAPFWNPAGMLFIKRPRLMLTHAEQFGQLLNHDYGAYVHPMGESGVIALSGVRMSIDDIPDTRGLDWDDEGGCDGDPGVADSCQGNGRYDRGETILYDDGRIFWRSDSEMALLISYARQVRRSVAVGASFKIVRQSLMSHNSLGVGIDVGAIVSPHERVSFGIKISDLNRTRLAWDTGEKDYITPRLFVGIQYMGSAWGSPFCVSQDVHLDFDGETVESQVSMGDLTGELRSGFEIWVRNVLALRVGLSAGDLTGGAGLRLGRYGIDYAFLAHDALGGSHRIGVEASF